MRFFHFFDFQIGESSNPVVNLNDVMQKFTNLQHQVENLAQRFQQFEQRVDGSQPPESLPTPKSYSNKFIASRIIFMEGQIQKILENQTKNDN